MLNTVNRNLSVFVNMVFDSKKLLRDAKMWKIVHLRGPRSKLKANEVRDFLWKVQ